MKKLILLIFTFYALITNGQEVKPKNTSFEFYGFVRFESYLDTYKGLNAANEQFYLIPLFIGTDANGKHINQTPTYNFSAMATRVGVRISGPEILNARTTANIETDFAGDLGVNPAMLRVRQANAVFSWSKTSLLVGQTWHPFWSGKVFPIVGGLNTGAPFQPFNRSPQIRVDYKPNTNLILSGALVSEFQYKSYGFSKIDSMYPAAMLCNDKSELFNRNAAIPEMIFNAEMNDGGFTIGAGTSLKYIQPTLYTVEVAAGPDRNKYVNTQLLHSLSFIGYSQYVKNKFTVKAKAVLGQNMTHLNIPGGYGVKSVDLATGAMTYTPYNSFASFVNAVYGAKYQVSIFGGYMQNLGTKDPLFDFNYTGTLQAVTPGLVPKIASIYRVAPSFAFNISKLRLVLEYELTKASNGTGPINFNDGLYSNSVDVTNHRGLLMMMYSF